MSLKSSRPNDDEAVDIDTTDAALASSVIMNKQFEQSL